MENKHKNHLSGILKNKLLLYNFTINFKLSLYYIFAYIPKHRE